MSVFRESCVLSLLLLFLAVYIPSQKYEADLELIRNGLLSEEGFPSREGENRVAIGFGSCVDVTTNGVQVMEKLRVAPPNTTSHNSVIETQEQLAQTFGFFFERGSASE